MFIQREWLALQKDSSVQHYSGNRASDVPTRGSTLRPVSKTSRPPRRPKNGQHFEESIILATHAYRRTKSGVAAPVVP